MSRKRIAELEKEVEELKKEIERMYFHLSMRIKKLEENQRKDKYFA